MPETWLCKECDRTLRCSCSSQECAFEYDITSHMNTHECSCETKDNGVRIRCAKCTWFGN